jgi:hypothetical protein
MRIILIYIIVVKRFVAINQHLIAKSIKCISQVLCKADQALEDGSRVVSAYVGFKSEAKEERSQIKAKPKKTEAKLSTVPKRLAGLVENSVYTVQYK